MKELSELEEYDQRLSKMFKAVELREVEYRKSVEVAHEAELAKNWALFQMNLAQGDFNREFRKRLSYLESVERKKRGGE